MDVPLLLAGCYFWPLGMWWLLQTTKKFVYCKQRRIEFVSSIACSCCQSCPKCPVEGIVKVLSCSMIMIYCFASSTDFGRAGKVDNYSDLCHGTVFTFFFISSATDLAKSVRGKLFIDDLDYATLALSFGVQSLLYRFHIPGPHTEQPTVNALMMMSAFCCCVVVIAEIKMRNQIFCPILRGFLLMVLGSWVIHSSLVLMETTEEEEQSHNLIMSVSMYYTWHVAINFVLVVCGWIVTYKLMAVNKCCCVPFGLEGSGDAIFLENRIRFDYHVLDRLDSDIE